MQKFYFVLAFMIYSASLLPYEQEHANEKVKVTLIFGAFVGGVTYIFWEQIKEHWVAVAVSTVVHVALYLMIYGCMIADLFAPPPEPPMARLHPAVQRPPELHLKIAKVTGFPPSNRKLRDMARLPFK
jgi:hypothetical protein